MDERYEVIVTPKAEENLESIIDYLILNESWETAERVRLTLLEEIETLTNMPSANGILQEISDTKLTFRRRLKWHYRIILIDEEEKLVFVVAVDHTRQNPQKLIDGHI